MTLDNLIIIIKSVLNKDKNYYYHNIFLEKCLFQLAKKLSQKFSLSYNSVENWKDKSNNNKKSFMLQKNLWDVNVDNIVISKLVKTKTNSKYLIGYFDKDIKPLVLIMLEMSGYVETFKVKDGHRNKNNKLMSFRIDNEKVLEKYKAIWTKIEDLKNIELKCFKSLWW